MFRQPMLLLALATAPSLAAANPIGDPAGLHATGSPSRLQSWSGQPALKLAALTSRSTDSHPATSRHSAVNPQTPQPPASTDASPAGWTGFIPSGPDSANWWSSY
ncbi:MAG: hypothetical protein JSS57_11140 [Proteobacteria bacterium]|nr:hypothetical protein [Pseudomonadota bacterium]